MERLTVGTHQGHCISQAGASLLQAKTILPPNCLTTRFHAIVNVVNKRKITQQADNTRDPAARLVVFQFQRRSSTACCAGAVARLAHAYAFIKHMTSPVDIFSFLNWLAQFFFLENTKTEAYLLFSALLGCKSFKTRRDVSSKKWASPENGL